MYLHKYQYGMRILQLLEKGEFDLDHLCNMNMKGWMNLNFCPKYCSLVLVWQVMLRLMDLNVKEWRDSFVKLWWWSEADRNAKPQSSIFFFQTNKNSCDCFAIFFQTFFRVGLLPENRIQWLKSKWYFSKWKNLDSIGLAVLP